MRISFLILCITLFPFVGMSQSKNKQLARLEEFLENHIPPNHMSVIGYNLSIKEGVLTKETLVDDGTSHSTTFNLKSQITYTKLQMDDESAEVYGFKDYWEVHIGASCILTEILEEKDALKLVDMLKKLQDSLT